MHECSIEREVMKNAGIKRIDTYRDMLNELNITIINDRETIKLLREQNEKLKEQLSSAQPDENRKSEWVLITDNRGQHFECKKCGEWRYHVGQKFCGNCGAKMEKGKTDEVEGRI